MNLRSWVGVGGGVLLSAFSGLTAPPTVVLTHALRTGNAYQLEWSSSPADFQFTVETRENLTAAQWQPVPGVTWPITNTTVLLPNSALVDSFFRIRAVPNPANRGAVVAVTQTATLPAFQIQLLLGLQGITSITPRNGVRFYQVRYETVDAHGFKTQASGGLAVPDVAGGAFPLISYQHGTVTQREDVPSRLNTEGFLGAVLASLGYVATLPDYLGLGDSPGIHPYHHAESEATATIDLLRAARTWCSSNSVSLNTKLFLTGYSEGGHATLAAMRAIEARHTNEFKLTAVVGGAGAYDLAGITSDEILQKSPSPNPYYLAYLLNAYVDVYGLASSLSDLFVAPYAATVPPLLDGTHDSTAINSALPTIAANMLRPEYFDDFKLRPDHPLRVALRANSLIEWTPRAPLRLYHCAGDKDVPPGNTQIAYDSFVARGATQVERFDPLPAANHSGCVEPTLLAALAWFESLR